MYNIYIYIYICFCWSWGTWQSPSQQKTHATQAGSDCLFNVQWIQFIENNICKDEFNQIFRSMGPSPYNHNFNSDYSREMAPQASTRPKTAENRPEEDSAQNRQNPPPPTACRVT